MSLVLSIGILFILLIQLVNGAKLLNTTFISLLPPPTTNAATFIVPVTSMYTSL